MKHAGLGHVLIVPFVTCTNGTRRIVVVENHRFDSPIPKFPGGGIELGESAMDAARRELKEETCLDASFGENFCEVGKLIVYPDDSRRHEEHIFVITFTLEYVKEHLPNGFSDEGLIPYDVEIPLGNSRRFLTAHRERVRTVSEELYADLFVPV